MIEHLLYVMWHDHWKPWFKNKIEWATYIGLGLLVTALIALAFIFLTVEVERILEGLYK